MSERQVSEFTTFGFVENKLRRGLVITFLALQTAAIVALFVLLANQDSRHRRAEETLRTEHRNIEAGMRSELLLCKDKMADKIEELENRQFAILKELYMANARLKAENRRK